MRILASVLAFISAIVFVVSLFMKSKKKILATQLGCNVLDITMYLVVGGMSGLANTLTELLKNISFVKFNNSKAVILCSIVRISLLVIWYENVLSAIFIVIEMIMTYVTLRGTAQQLRLVALIKQITWVVYDGIMATLVVAMTDCIGVVFDSIAIIRYRKGEEIE